MTRTFHLETSALALLFAAPLLGTEKKVLIIGIDGLRPDALVAADTPHLDSLSAAGATSYVAQVGPNTVSGPGWSNMLTGVWSDRHGVVDNGFAGANYGEYPDLFVRLEQSLPGVDTAALLTWAPLADLLINGADFEFFQDYTNGGDAAVTLVGAQLLSMHDYDALFVYFADVDVAGHTHGFSPGSTLYLTEIEQVDGQVGLLLDAIQSRPTLPDEDWLILVSTDHGGIGTGHGGGAPEARTIPYIASGPSTTVGPLHTVPNVVDVAATALVHLGVDLDPAWKLDGRPLGFPEPTEFGRNLLFNSGAEHAPGNIGWSADRGVPGWRDIGNLTTILYDSGGGFPASTDPGPVDRGASFFAGGPGASDDVMTLTVDLSDIAVWVDQAGVLFDLAGFLGGYAEQEDRMTLSARFLNDAGGHLASTAIGPVTLADRQAAIGGSGEALTGLLHRATSGVLPSGTRRIEFEVLAEHFAGGGTDGYGDEFSFVLGLAPSLDCDGNDIPDPRDLGAATHLDLDGDGVPDVCQGIGTPYCPGAPNSAGTSSVLYATGTTSVGALDLTLQAQGLPANVAGLFYFGTLTAAVPFGAGLRCVAGSTFRLQPPTFATPTGIAGRTIDFAAAPAFGNLAPGSTWQFQFWYRDLAGGPGGFNLSNGLTLAFTP